MSILASAIVFYSHFSGAENAKLRTGCQRILQKITPTLKAMAAAFIGGAMAVLALPLADPIHFNWSGGLEPLLKAAGMAGIASAGFYLQRSPLFKDLTAGIPVTPLPPVAPPPIPGASEK